MIISAVARGEQKKRPPPKPGNFAEDGEQPMPQPTVILDIKSKFKFFSKHSYIILFKKFYDITKQYLKINKIFSNFIKFFFYILLKILKIF